MIDTDLYKLDPIFRDRVEKLLSRLRARGHDAVLHEGWRSFERAKLLADKGTGVVKSMHCYGLAADIISSMHRWSPDPKFWLALGAHARLLGLVWGGDFKKVDKPHVQAVRVSDQSFVRTANLADVRALVKRRLG